MILDFFKSILVNSKTGEPSLTALFSIVSFIACLVACFLEMFDVVKTTSSVIEIFLICMGSYLGRRIDFPTRNKAPNESSQV